MASADDVPNDIVYLRPVVADLKRLWLPFIRQTVSHSDADVRDLCGKGSLLTPCSGPE